MSLIRPTTRTIAGIGAGAAGLLLFAGAAAAHLEPDPASITAGQAATVAFNVEHGCDGSPTIELQIKLADGITDAQPVQKEGWTSSVAGGVVTFTGGSLAADKQDTFSITFTAPTTNGALVFPSIQKCTVGQINWIEPTVEGQPEPEDPAPVVQVTGGSDATATTVATASTATATTSSAIAAPDTTSAATAAPDATEPATTAASGAATTAAETATTEGGGGSSNAGLVTVIIIAALVVLAGAGYALYRARSGGDEGTPGAPGGPGAPGAPGASGGTPSAGTGEPNGTP